MDNLKLIALDADDLEVISAHLEDSLIRLGDMVYLPKEKKFVFTTQRMDWETSQPDDPHYNLTGVHFERVTAVRSRGLDLSNKDATLCLLAIVFNEKDKPSGTATLVFTRYVEIELEIECIEVQMKDLGIVPSEALKETRAQD
ncbi:DUF2948 family protein [Microvirga sp. W0021]|uniref:DUF2948 family protein n=1 Tax=Hohaiivirga grylli TaxID=3133970 RepID=A0ABV0BIV1_9HYPH